VESGLDGTLWVGGWELARNGAVGGDAAVMKLTSCGIVMGLEGVWHELRITIG
jgi:allantoicase